MDILAVIRREEQALEKQVSKMQTRLDGLRSAAKALGNSANHELIRARKRVLSAAARAKMSAAAKKRWAKVKAGAKKAVS
jgi:hypothetical protein